MKRGFIFFILLFSLATSGHVFAQSDIESRIRALEDVLKKQAETIQAQQIMIDELKAEINKKTEVAAAPESKEKQTEVQTAPKAAGLFGGAAMSNPNISLVLNTYGYSSNLTTEEVRNRSIAGYTTRGIDRRNGFNLEAAEVALYAPVDSFFNLYATIPVTDDGAELEEAYFVTTCLPRGHQIKGGKFKSGFGRLNSQHSHVWDFVDAPLPYRAFIGDEGFSEKGIQYTYLLPLPFYAIVGVEALQGDNDLLFGSDAASGIHAYTAFVKASLDIGDNSTILFGPSVLTGKTKTDTVAADSDFSGDTTLYGLEFTYKWQPSKDRGFKIQSEYLLRTQSGDLTDTGSGLVQSLERSQDGLYFQGIFKQANWEFGARYDILSLFKDDYTLAGEKQDWGRRPWRASGMINYNFSEFSLLRLQYNHDESDVTGKPNDELFLQFIFAIGAHPAHKF